ncbi:acetate/propionate family kinase [Rhabdothermincola sp.]|uniref:acetate/propionate family kinase n=1 Tax=Rhabdothermincola sp. TaxID=2820405 RepID=UPI002FDF65F3
MHLLVVNLGSSSLKLRLLDPADRVVADAHLPVPVDPGAVERFLRGSVEPAAIAHRVVHGGERFRGPTLVDDAVLHALDELSVLAPLHNPPTVELIRHLATLLPGMPAVACFDTAYHASMPSAATTYAVPATWRERSGIRRYGFHGLSHAHASRRVAELLGRPLEQLSVITCHLGAGASLAAIEGGRSVDTTMGFTPLEGLVMATRSGDIDPAAVLWLQQRAGLSADEVGDALNHRSGLLALAGTPDLRVILTRARSGDPQAASAVDVYVHRLVKGIAAMRASLARFDALVFTGGVGENASEIRAMACARLGFLGLPEVLDEPDGDTVVSPEGSTVAVAVVAAREDLEMARQARSVLTGVTTGG